MSVRVIANPASGRGRGVRALPAVRAAFAAVGVSDVRLTTGAGDERRLALEAAQDGVETLAVLGGDGTWSKVACALVDAGAGTHCRLALLGSGTGNDFAKTVGVPATDYPAMARLALSGRDALIDVGQIGDAHFLNVAGFGFSAAVLQECERIRWLRGDALYFYAALRQLFRYPGFDATVTMEGGERAARRTRLGLIVCNGRHFGGSFRIAPNASLSDGLLDAITIETAGPLTRAKLFAAATRGTHLAYPEIGERKTTSLTIRWLEPPIYEADGELRRAMSDELEIRCVPGALRVVTGETEPGTRNAATGLR